MKFRRSCACAPIGGGNKHGFARPGFSRIMMTLMQYNHEGKHMHCQKLQKTPKRHLTLNKSRDNKNNQNGQHYVGKFITFYTFPLSASALLRQASSPAAAHSPCRRRKPENAHSLHHRPVCESQVQQEIVSFHHLPITGQVIASRFL